MDKDNNIWQITQCAVKTLLPSAGPNVRAGFMLHPVNGPWHDKIINENEYFYEFKLSSKFFMTYNCEWQNGDGDSKFDWHSILPTFIAWIPDWTAQHNKHCGGNHFDECPLDRSYFAVKWCQTYTATAFTLCPDFVRCQSLKQCVSDRCTNHLSTNIH